MHGKDCALTCDAPRNIVMEQNSLRIFSWITCRYNVTLLPEVMRLKLYFRFYELSKAVYKWFYGGVDFTAFDQLVLPKAFSMFSCLSLCLCLVLYELMLYENNILLLQVHSILINAHNFVLIPVHCTNLFEICFFIPFQ